MSRLTEVHVKDVRPYAIDPIFLGRAQRSGVSAKRAATISVAFALAIVFLAALDNNLRPEEGVRGWLRTLESFVNARAPLADRAGIPLLDDVAVLGLFVSIPVSTYLVFRLFELASALHTDLAGKGCLWSVGTATDWSDLVDDLNEALKKAGSHARLNLFGCFLFCLMLMVSLKWGDPFRYLKPVGLSDQEWSSLAANSWWGSLNDPFRPAGVALLLWGTFGAYLVVVQSTLGWNYVRFLKDSSGIVTFAPNSSNEDRYFGWSMLREIHLVLMVGLSMGMVSGLSIYIYASGTLDSLVAGVAGIGFLLLAVFVLVSLVSGYRNSVLRYQSEELRRLESLLPSIDESSSNADLERRKRIRAEMDRIRALPAIPFRKRAITLAGVVASLPVVAAALDIISRY